MHQGTSNFLNASRWIAALFVVIGHVFSISLVNYYNSDRSSLLLKGNLFFWWLWSSLGHGLFRNKRFPCWRSYNFTIPENDFEPVSYCVARISRIYTVFIPALIIGLIIDKIGISLLNDSGIYFHPDNFYYNSLGNDISRHLSIGVLVANVMQLQTILTSSLGSNAPLWSLANEWWYYVIFGLFMIGYRSQKIRMWGITSSAIIIILIGLPLPISLWFALWVIGAGVAVLDRYWRGLPFWAGVTVMLICLVAGRWTNNRQIRTGIAAHFAVDLAAALGYSIALVSAKNQHNPRKFKSFHRSFAGFSYTTYLVHFPAMVFIAAFLKTMFNIGFVQQPTAARKSFT